jgi:hypothetical protein
VSPRNPRSLANLVASGLWVVALVEKYGDVRFMLRWQADPAPDRAPGPGAAALASGSGEGRA